MAADWGQISMTKPRAERRLKPERERERNREREIEREKERKRERAQKERADGQALKPNKSPLISL
jgi:hypothetical protein